MVGPEGPEDNPKNILMLPPGFLFLNIHRDQIAERRKDEGKGK